METKRYETIIATTDTGPSPKNATKNRMAEAVM